MSSITQFGKTPQFRQWCRYLKTLTWEPGSLDHSCYCASLRSASLGIPEEAVYLAISSLIAAAGDAVKEGKVWSQIHRARAFISQTGGGSPLGRGVGIVTVRGPGARRKPVEFEPDKLLSVTVGFPTDDPEELIKHRSPFNPNYVTSADYLARVYGAGEKVVLFTRFQSQGQHVWERDRHPQQYIPPGGPEGVWYLTNPVDGEYHPNPREAGKPSRRSQESITCFRFAVLESDEADANDWLCFLAKAPLRIVAIYSSGVRSIHALVRVDATRKADWDAKINPVKPLLTTLGADPGALTAVRLSRLPQAYRGENLQRLIYLAPDAEGTPILRLPPRPIHVDWCQWLQLELAANAPITKEDAARFLQAVEPVKQDPSIAALIAYAQEVLRAR